MKRYKNKKTMAIMTSKTVTIEASQADDVSTTSEDEEEQSEEKETEKEKEKDDKSVDSDTCDKCGDGGKLVGCDHCSRWYHAECVAPLVIPTKKSKAEFKCPVCLEEKDGK